MAAFKCKMCGGQLDIQPGATVLECEYCGTQQTLPKLDDDRKTNLYDRANHFRRNNDYDKAMGIYEQILSADSTDAEAYWSLVLCRYGIEYVEDPATRKRVPTVNRAQFTSVYDDADYKAALQYADIAQRAVYEAEAKAINEIQKGILAISQQEEPFDVFICYKDTDNNGRRTQDSVLANDLYHQLTQEGFKVFFARITLEDKLGSAYEPYIFAALNSAKVMVVLGTRPEFFNAVWVKNEWSRYLALIKQGQKKMLIPAFRDMDPYDLPEEFSHLQAQDMSKLGFMQDLIRGIKKILSADAPAPAATTVQETVVVNAAAASADPLLKRAFMFLEDGDFDRADEFCEQVLNLDPENARAYVGKLMADLRVKKQDDLKNCALPFDGNGNYQKAVRFGDEALRTELKGYVTFIKERNENARLEAIYTQAKSTMIGAVTVKQYTYAADLFSTIPGYKDADECCATCKNRSIEANKKQRYNGALREMEKDTVQSLTQAQGILRQLRDWKDAQQLAKKCEQRIEELKEQKRIAEENARLAEEKKKKLTKRVIAISLPSALAVIIFVILLLTVIIPGSHYKQGENLLAAGDYFGARQAFDAAKNYKDARERKWAAMPPDIIDAGATHTVALKSDGTVVAVGNNFDGQCNVRSWTNIVAVSAGDYHTVGLKSDGTVVAAGSYYFEQCNVQDWTDIVAVSAGYYHTVGLKSDGTVVAVGSNYNGECDVQNWTDIVAVSAGNHYTVGLKSDGTVVAVGDNYFGQCNVQDWTDIVAVSAGSSHTVGLKSNGKVVAVGYDDYSDSDHKRCNVKSWRNIVAISAGKDHTVGLKSDGTVVAVGGNWANQCNAQDWTDIVAIGAGYEHTIGLKSDGTVVAIGNNDKGACDVQSWDIDTYR